MEIQTIKTGTCPVCGSNEVYDNRSKNPGGYRSFIMVSATKSFLIDQYVCLNCGYFMEFINDEFIKNEKIINKLKEKWHKTGSGANAG